MGHGTPFILVDVHSGQSLTHTNVCSCRPTCFVLLHCNSLPCWKCSPLEKTLEAVDRHGKRALFARMCGCTTHARLESPKRARIQGPGATEMLRHSWCSDERLQQRPVPTLLSSQDKLQCSTDLRLSLVSCEGTGPQACRTWTCQQRGA